MDCGAAVAHERAPEDAQPPPLRSSGAPAATCPNSTLLDRAQCLPHFLLIGAQKSGTSTMAQLISQHPQVVSPKRKELLFYMPDVSAVRYGQTGRAATLCHPFAIQHRNYLQEFGPVTPAQHNRTGAVTGEFSATYLACACCAFAAKSFTPRVRLVAILRHPIDRALSRYHEQRFFLTRIKKPVEVFTLPWPAFVASYLAEVKKCVPRVAPDEGEDSFGNAASDLDCSFSNTAQYAVIGWSRYAAQLKPWLAAFGSEALLVLYTDELKSDPALVMRRVEAHLGLAPFQYSNINATYNARGAYGWRIEKGSEAAKNPFFAISLRKNGGDEGSVTKKGGSGGHGDGNGADDLDWVRHQRRGRRRLLLDSVDLSGDWAARHLLRAYYRQSLVSLHAMALEGLISPLPAAWVREWGLAGEQGVLGKGVTPTASLGTETAQDKRVHATSAGSEDESVPGSEFGDVELGDIYGGEEVESFSSSEAQSTAALALVDGSRNGPGNSSDWLEFLRQPGSATTEIPDDRDATPEPGPSHDEARTPPLAVAPHGPRAALKSFLALLGLGELVLVPGHCSERLVKVS